MQQQKNNKRRRLNPQQMKNKTIFHNIDDETQCLKIIYTLDEVINCKKVGNNNNNKVNKITWPLLKEIAQYSTGNYVKCKGELDHEECNGYIHFLQSDNFQTDLNCFNCWNLYKYECDDDNCSIISHVFTCNDEDCKKIIQIKDDASPYPNSICENALRLKPLCKQVYCVEHKKKNGRTCETCNNFYCFSCESAEGNKCSTCDKYWCYDHIEEATFFIGTSYYCNECMSSGYCVEENPFLCLYN